MSKYYWANSVSLSEGSEVLPGSWSRIKQIATGDPWTLLEEVYERVRLDRFRNLPSRMKSLFIFQDEKLAKQFQTTRPFDLIYEVAITNENANKSLLDMNIVQYSSSGRLLSAKELEEQAARYWSSTSTNSEQMKTPELLTESSIKIIKLLEDE